VIDFAQDARDGYQVRLYANTPEQLVQCYRSIPARSAQE